MLNGTRVSRALKHNTVSSYMGILSGVWNWARKNGYISYEVLSPFAEQRRPYQPTASRALTIEEVRKLWSCEPKNIYQAVALDMFKLSFMLCGLNPADMFLLTDAETKGHRINTQRQKTGVSINILIMPEAQEIFDRYKLGKWMLGQILSAKDKARGETYLTNCKVNKALDQIMPGLTMYYARHTWMSLGAELDIPDRVLFMGIAHKMGKYSDETYITMRHRKLDLANRRILDYVLQQGEFEPDPLDNM